MNTFTPQMTEMSDYPIYRKLSNQKSFYRIVSSTEFEEIQCIGSARIQTFCKAEKYPEMLRIKDMISCRTPFKSSSEMEFVSQKGT
jgi:hypothetical protein